MTGKEKGIIKYPLLAKSPWLLGVQSESSESKKYLELLRQAQYMSFI